MKRLLRLGHLCVIVTVLFLTGCASFRSGIEGAYQGGGQKNFGAAPVSVFFIFSHVRQIKGYDAVPKLNNKYQILSGFDDIFIDSITELSNLGGYATYTEFASDVSAPERRAKRDSMMALYDYTIKIRFKTETSFSRYFLGTLASTFSATVLPVRYSQHYTMEAQVYDSDQRLIATYKRQARLGKWVETLLIFVYPFHPEARKREEIYVGFMHDLFRQIESEQVLRI